MEKRSWIDDITCCCVKARDPLTCVVIMQNKIVSKIGENDCEKLPKTCRESSIKLQGTYLFFGVLAREINRERGLLERGLIAKSKLKFYANSLLYSLCIACIEISV